MIQGPIVKEEARGDREQELGRYPTALWPCYLAFTLIETELFLSKVQLVELER